LPPLSCLENPGLQTPMLNKIEIFKNSNFSLIQLMKNSRDKMSETMSIRNGGASQISTPRLTPLKMLDRNRNQLVSKDDIQTLESKIKELEDQIHLAKNKPEEKKLEKPVDERASNATKQETHSKLTQENLLKHDAIPYLLSVKDIGKLAS
jgi:hypothetical protein